MKLTTQTGPQKQRGLTLAELLVSLMIFSLLASGLGAIANSLMSSNRMVNTGNQLINDLNLARSTALNLGQEVSLCAADGTGSACSGGNTWKNGWIVYIDKNGDRSLQSNEEILHQQGPIGGSISVTANMANDNNQWNTYQADGSVTYLGSFHICDPNLGNEPRRVVLPRVRRPYITKKDVVCP